MQEPFEDVLNRSSLLRSVFNNAKINAVQVMDEDGYIVHLNESFTHHFGYMLEDLKGKHSRVLFTEADQKQLMPEMEITKVKQHGQASDRNYIMHKDGSCIWTSGESVLLKDDGGSVFIFKLIQDIHEQKLQEKFIKESQEFSENVVKGISDALIVIDTSIKIHKANNAFYNFFRINQDSIEGLYLKELPGSFWSSDDLYTKLQATIETGAAGEFEMEWEEGDLQKRYLSIKSRFLDGKLADKRILLIVADVTDKVQADQQRDDLISFVIHELRNPLANISLCYELLEQSIHDDDMGSSDEFLVKMKRNIERLNTLIRELFDATRAGSGNLQFFKTNFSFDELLQEAVESVQMSTTSHTILLEGSTGSEVLADRNRLIQVLTNFLINAIKYSPAANKVDVRISLESGQLVVAITDYGEGIPEEKIKHLFDRYYRADKENKAEGLGLGLYLSKQIIDAHKGRVWIDSKPGSGSTFYFSLPVS